MILAVDMGNTNIVIGGIDKHKTYFVERMSTVLHKTDLEYAVLIKTILDLHNVDPQAIEGAIISSVVPPLTNIIRASLYKVTGKNPLIVTSGMKTGLNILMDNPKTLGADLVVGSVAAMSMFQLPLIVIDMGTATTMCVVNQKAQYIGGIIYPGLKVSLESLSGRTSQLPHISLERPEKTIGKNTIDCMRSGIIYGNASMIDGMIDRMETELGCHATVIATGGLAQFITPYCLHKIHYVDDLLLKGLMVLYRMNTEDR